MRGQISYIGTRLVCFLICLFAFAVSDFAQAQVFNTIGTVTGFPISIDNPHISPDGTVIVGNDGVTSNNNNRKAYTVTYSRTTDQLGSLFPINNAIGTTNPSWTDATGVTDPEAGQVIVGRASVPVPPFNTPTNEAFRLTSSGMTGLGFLTGGLTHGGSIAWGANAGIWNSDVGVIVSGGSVVVGSSYDNSGLLKGFVWSSAAPNGLTTISPLPGDTWSEARAVSADASTVVGGSCSTANPTPVCQPFVWTSSSFTGLGSLPGYFISEAYDVSANGSVIVGPACNVTNVQTCQAFRWTASTGMVGLTSGIAYAVNEAGDIVVGSIMDNSGHEVDAFIWAGTGAQSLTAILTAHGVKLTGWTLTAATGVSADGTVVVGRGLLNGVQRDWVARLPASVVHHVADTHDFNGDGKSDILWRDTAGDVGIWLMNGSQILVGQSFDSVPLNWSIVGQRDFDSDGKADILWRDTAGDVGIWLMNGTQIVQGGSFNSLPLSWSIVGTGDFNADGKADILWRDTSGNVGLWLMNGTTIIQAGVVGQMATSYIVVGSDMRGDIFWRNTSTGEVVIWIMNGMQIAQSVSLGTVSLDWAIVGIGDFDGNGSEDILWRDSAGDVAVWLMNSTQIMSNVGIGNVTTNWNIVQTGDYNGDGKSDILWFDSVGDVGIWFMNGATVSSGYAFSNIGTAWSVQSINAE